MKRFYIILTALIVLSTTVFALAPAESGLLKKGVFAQRRQAFMEKMDGGIAILKGADAAVRNRDIDYEFRQNSFVYYLTGFEEPGAVFVLVPGAAEKFIMFVQPRNLMAESWIGRRYGVEGAKEIFGADAAYPIEAFEKKLPRLLRGKEKIYCNFNDKDIFEKVQPLVARRGGQWPGKLLDLRKPISEMRVIKGPEEIELMQRAADITGDALLEIMKTVKPGMFEYEVEAILDYTFKKNNCPRHGFQPIVASGPNGGIMHYEDNHRQTRPGEMLLLDVGAEYEYYSADITRTIPVNGKFSKKQKRIYNLVLEAQQKSIAAVKPGVGIREVMNHSVEVMKEGLFKLGLITDRNTRWQHYIWVQYTQVSHWLGIDCHDVGNMDQRSPKGRILEPGMVFTVEPGIYINSSYLDRFLKAKQSFVPKKELEDFVAKVKDTVKKYDAINVRIEDDVLVTPDGRRVLSAKTPKKIADIEKLMK